MKPFDRSPGQISCVVHAGSALIVLSGELDVFDALNFGRIRDEVLAGATRNVTVDAADVSFVDCAFLGALVVLAQDCQWLGVRFRVAEPSPTVARLCGLLGLDEALQDTHRGAVSP